MSDEKIKLIFEKCPRDKANDKKLPSDSFVVSYNDKEELKYYIVRAVSYTHLTLPTTEYV